MAGARRSGSLNIAFLGCGAATRMHARTLSRVAPDVGVHFASRDAARADAFRRAHGSGRAFGAYGDALADDGMDAAFVATPPSSHRELVLAALAAGRHVIVEKPAFPRSADFAVVREAAVRAGRRVLVAENYFYKPLRRRLAEVLADGRLGRPLFLRVNAAKRQRAAGWRAEPALAGGGALMEGGIHWVHLMASLGLEVRSVTGFRAGPGRGGDESALVVFAYEGGAVGTLAYSWSVPSPLRGLRLSQVMGTEGTATFESNGLFLFERGRRLAFRLPGLRDISGYRAMFADFVAVLRRGGEPGMTFDMAERDVRLVEQATRSMDEPGGGSQAR
ncbi:MAG: Gfo/Idh/MocA family oxidoreductase [Gemmatimonadota bacterium]|nr:Gfo/Idh/MocA family oxidoreductase [Gemmatimonadota bacterium]